MNAVYCLDCNRRLHINSTYDVGDAIKCPNCNSEFEIISMHPPAIEWLYDSYDDYDEEEEYAEARLHRAATQDQRQSNESHLIYSAYWDE